MEKIDKYIFKIICEITLYNFQQTSYADINGYLSARRFSMVWRDFDYQEITEINRYLKYLNIFFNLNDETIMEHLCNFYNINNNESVVDMCNKLLFYYNYYPFAKIKFE